ncbi:MAG: hypothetical protein LQ349_007796 [Xanthoria aureola]|nr:MAG: hypothetical protein LQ349_007796 [Xanthoria aureola]
MDENIVFVGFGGGMTTRMVKRPDCAFAYEITVHDEHPQVIPMRTQRPPAHFHPYQCEYIEVLEGQMGLETGGCDRVLRPEDGQVRVEPWTIHRLFAPPLQARKTKQPDNEATGRITRFLLSGEDTTELFKLDTIFFQNWYKYQEEVEKGRTRMNLIQVMCMFDAGGSYLAPPSWIPGGRLISQAVGIAMGRWLGAILGYQPFYREWTTDWSSACDKMDESYFQRKFADRKKMD